MAKIQGVYLHVCIVWCTCETTVVTHLVTEYNVGLWPADEN